MVNIGHHRAMSSRWLAMELLAMFTVIEWGSRGSVQRSVLLLHAV